MIKISKSLSIELNSMELRNFYFRQDILKMLKYLYNLQIKVKTFTQQLVFILAEHKNHLNLDKILKVTMKFLINILIK